MIWPMRVSSGVKEEGGWGANLKRVLEGKDLLVELGSLLGREASLLLLVHVDLVKFLLREELELGESLLERKLVCDVSLVVPAVLGDLGLELSLELLGVGDGLDLLLEVANLGLERVGLASGAA